MRLDSFERRGQGGGLYSPVDPWLLRRLLAGMSPRALSVAGGIALRTAQRWKATLVRVETIRVDGWQAEFAIRRGCPPLRITLWTKSVDKGVYADGTDG